MCKGTELWEYKIYPGIDKYSNTVWEDMIQFKQWIIRGHSSCINNRNQNSDSSNQYGTEVKDIRIWSQICAITSASEITLCITLGKLLNMSLHLPTSKMGNNKEFYLFHRVIMRVKLDNVIGQWFSTGGNFALPPPPGTFSMSGDSFGCHYWRIGELLLVFSR